MLADITCSVYLLLHNRYHKTQDCESKNYYFACNAAVCSGLHIDSSALPHMASTGPTWGRSYLTAGIRMVVWITWPGSWHSSAGTSARAVCWNTCTYSCHVATWLPESTFAGFPSEYPEEIKWKRKTFLWLSIGSHITSLLLYSQSSTQVQREGT